MRTLYKVRCECQKYVASFTIPSNARSAAKEHLKKCLGPCYLSLFPNVVYGTKKDFTYDKLFSKES